LSISDSSVLESGKGLSETLTLSESQIWALDKPYSDSLSCTDSAGLGYEKPLTETLSVSEQSVFTHNKILTDGFTLDDTAQVDKECTSVKGNVFSVTDSISLSRIQGRALGNMVLGSLTLN